MIVSTRLHPFNKAVQGSQMLLRPLKIFFMSEILKKTINQLPDLLVKNAPSMMQRMAVAMQTEIAQDSKLANASYCALVLKLSTPDLVREFDVAIKAAMASIKQGGGKSDPLVSGLSLSLDDAGAGQNTNDFDAAISKFATLCANARAQKIEVAAAYGKDCFLTALKDAFSASRIDSTEATKLMPYAQRALNAELVNLYEKLNSL